MIATNSCLQYKLEVFREDIPHTLSGKLRADEISSVHHIAYPIISGVEDQRVFILSN